MKCDGCGRELSPDDEIWVKKGYSLAACSLKCAIAIFAPDVYVTTLEKMKDLWMIELPEPPKHSRGNNTLEAWADVIMKGDKSENT